MQNFYTAKKPKMIIPGFVARNVESNVIVQLYEDKPYFGNALISSDTIR
jgi:hypothetical protein